MNNIPEGKTLNLDDIFANLPTEAETYVSLPSKGKFYPTSKLKVRPMTFQDEKAILNARKDKTDALNVLLSRCVEGVNVQDLLLIDKLFLILKIREISYGDEYSVQVGCAACSTDNPLTFKLSDLPVSEVEDTLTDPIKVILPITKVEVEIKLPRVSDEHYLRDDNSAYDNLWRFVKTVNGSDDPVLISKMMKDPRMPLKDMHTLINSMSLSDYGIQTKVKFSCTSCDQPNIINLPLGADFFTVS